MKVALNRRRASWPFLSEVFFLFPQVFLQAGDYGAPWKNNRGGWEKKMGQKKKLLGEISSSPQKETQARKNVEYYINIVFPFCTDFFWKKADKPKEKTGNGSGLGIIFPIGQKKSRNQLTRIFFFLVSAMLLQVTLRRPSVSWWKLLQCTGFRWKPSLHLRLVYSFSSDYHILIGAKNFWGT